MDTINATMNNNTTVLNNGINDVLKEINGVLETAISTNTVLNTDEISEVLGVIRGVLETITETTANNANETASNESENEVDLADVLETLLETSSNESENDNESKTWNEPYFLDSNNASKALKEWADRTSDSFFEEHDIGNIHPDYTAVRVPVRFHRELRKLGMARDYRSSGTYLWEGVWYFPADREFLELIDSE